MEQNLEIVKVFNHAEFGNVRVIGDVENPRFCLADVCKVLELQAAAVMRRLDKGVTSSHPLQTAGGIQQVTFINEDGLYDVILDSRKPAAKKFRKWLTSEVIPSIRKTGFYATQEKIEEIVRNPDLFIEQLMSAYKRVKSERDVALAQVASLKPKADYCESILQSKGGVPITIIAKDYGQSAAAFNQLLAKYKIQYRCGNAWVIKEPYSKLGYTESETLILKNGLAVVHTKWTQKGRMHLYNELKRHGILPTCERDNPMAVLL